jgi:hypothetical protein
MVLNVACTLVKAECLDIWLIPVGHHKLLSPIGGDSFLVARLMAREWVRAMLRKLSALTVFWRFHLPIQAFDLLLACN